MFIKMKQSFSHFSLYNRYSKCLIAKSILEDCSIMTASENGVDIVDQKRWTKFLRVKSN